MPKMLIVEGNTLIGINPHGDDFYDICRDFEYHGEEEVGVLIVPSNINKIGPEAFSNCSSFYEIIIPESVHSIGAKAFSSCPNLDRIVFQDCSPKPELTLRASVFEGCSAWEISYNTIRYETWADGHFGGSEYNTIRTSDFTFREYALLFSNCLRLNTVHTQKGDICISDLLSEQQDSLLKLALCYYALGFKLTHISGVLNNSQSFKTLSPQSITYQTLEEHNLNGYDYLYKYNWKVASGLGALLGYSDIRALDIDGVCNDYYIEQTLIELGLPKDYPWVVRTGSRKGFHIYFKSKDIDAPLTSVAFTKQEVCDSIVPNVVVVELRWKDHLVLPGSLHALGYYYEFWKGFPKEDISWVPISRVNDFIDCFCGYLTSFYDVKFNDKDITIGYPEKNYSDYGSYGYRKDNLAEDSPSWLKECDSPRAFIELALDYLETSGEISVINQAFNLLKKADENPLARFNLASLIAGGVFKGTQDDVEQYLCQLDDEFFLKYLNEKDWEIIKNRIKEHSLSLPIGKQANDIQEKRLLFFDTETNGLPIDYAATSANLNNWPRLVQLSWIITDSIGGISKVGNHIIKPEGFIIGSSQRVHGITQKKAMEEGDDLKTVLQEFVKDINSAQMIIGHNVEFDMKIVGAELLRSGYYDIFEGKHYFCTMKNTIDYCCLPGGHKGPKYPKLQELHSILFGKEYDNAHDSLDDVYATKSCYFELLNRNLIPKERFGGLLYSPEGWVPVETRPFTANEIESVSEALIVASQRGKTVQFTMKNGGITFIPLKPGSQIGVGEVFNVNEAKLEVLKRNDVETSYRVIVRPSLES